MKRFSRTMLVVLVWVPSYAQQAPRVDGDSRTVFVSGTLERRDPITGDQSLETQATLLELENLSASGLSNRPFLRELTLHQSGWLLGDIGVETRERPVTGNLRTLYVQYTRGPITARIGRQVIVGGATRYASIDGASFRLLARYGFEASAHGGWRSLPRLVESPYYARLGDRLGDFAQPGAPLEERTARGFALVGARLGQTTPNIGSAGVSFVHEIEAGQLARQALGFDASFERARWPLVMGNALYDTSASSLAETRIAASAGPWRDFTFMPSYRREDPTLLISKTSIFSVFDTTAYDETGADVLWNRGRWALEAGGFGLRYREGQRGGRARGAASVTAGRKRPIRARVSYERLDAVDRGYHAGRGAATMENVGPCRVSAELYAFLFDQPQNGIDYSITPQASVGTSRWGVDLDGALGWHTGPRVESGPFGMVKASLAFGIDDGRAHWRPERTRMFVPGSLNGEGKGDHILFSHRAHIALEFTCEDCHGKVANAAAGAHLIPGKPRCLECHEEKAQECAFCHTEPQRPQTFKPRPEGDGLVFSHQAHAGKRACNDCHATAAASERVADNLLPTMAVCLSCHEHQREFAQLQCQVCHARMPARMSMPNAEFYSHAGDFRRRHQDIARGRAEVCAACHAQTFCVDCHDREAPISPAVLVAERPDRAAFHRGYYLDRHAIEARAEPASCLRCHGRTSCDSCHLEVGVSGVSRVAVSPHPAGWLVAGSPSSHGISARRNLMECAACHDQGPASNCVPCHRPGGSGPSPHGPDFASALGMNDARVCRTCHAQP